MSDRSISIVSKQSSYQGNRETKAAEIVAWLVTEQAIEPTRSACVLGNEAGGYRLLPGMRQFCVEPKRFYPDMNPLGMEVNLQKTVYDTGENGLDKVSCPACPAEIPEDMFFDLVADWFHHGERCDLICPSCQNKISLEEIVTEPAWAFSDLGFTFWGCPDLHEEFIVEFEKRLGCPVSVVNCHL